MKYCIDSLQQYCIDVNSFPFGKSFHNLPNTTKFSQFGNRFEMAPGNSFFFLLSLLISCLPLLRNLEFDVTFLLLWIMNHLTVAKHRSPHRVAHSKTTWREQDGDCSPADSGDEEQVHYGMEYSSENSNYSEDESVTAHSKDESREEETDAEVEDTVDNGKGNVSTPVSRKGVTSDYDTPIADLLRPNRSREPEFNVTKRGQKLSQSKQRGLQNRKRNSTTLSNNNNEGASN
jgi:hypothetical protein